MKTCGVLALQGDFEAHAKAVRSVGGRALEVRTAQQLAQCDGLIIPGGESTTMLKLLAIEGLTEPLKQFAASRPVYGSCAGAILLATEVTHPAQESLGILDISIERNAYGRQIDSRVVRVKLLKQKLLGEGEEAGEMEAVFIRAPIIRRMGTGVSCLGVYQGNPVWVEQGRHMATTFHPELNLELTATEPNRLPVHRHFLAGL